MGVSEADIDGEREREQERQCEKEQQLKKKKRRRAGWILEGGGEGSVEEGSRRGRGRGWLERV